MDLLGNGTLGGLWPGGSPEKECKTFLTNNVASIAFYMLGFFFMVFLCNGSHAVLRPFSQPRIISESTVGLFLGNIPIIRNYFLNYKEGNKTLNNVADVGMIFHMFVLGLDIDPSILLRPPSRETKVGCAGMLSTFLLTILITPWLYFPKVSNILFNLSLSAVVSGTASPLLTRLITDKKIGKSDIGRFVVAAGTQSDLVSNLLLSIGYIIFDPLLNYRVRDIKSVLGMISTLVIQSVTAAKVSPIFMNWVNSENPEGKPIKGSHLVLSTAYVVVLCSCSPALTGFNKMLSAFLAGFFMPREGRISKMMINKVHYFLIILFNPLFFFYVGTETYLPGVEGGRIGTWARFFFLFVTTTAGKVAGTVASAVMLGFPWPESVAIGLLLNIKGHIHVYLAIIAKVNNIISASTSATMVFAALLTIIYTPLVVSNIIERARKRSPTQRMALQWLDPPAELRIMLCLHGPQNVPCALNFMEISRGPVEPGIIVFLTDMIELTDKVAATLSQGDGTNLVSVTDKTIMGKREQITNAVKAHLEEDGRGISIHRVLSLATIANMHQDLCIRAEDLLVSLIILPFHKDQLTDGRFNAGHPGFRHVNRKVLRHAPCSVAILVDRGLGSLNNIAEPSVPLNAAVIFIGGKDDREALAYASRMARHPGVKLTVIRFLLDSSSNVVTTRAGSIRPKTDEQEVEMKLDDEFFAEFYDKHVAGGYVAYMEKYVANSGETFSTLQSFQGLYELFVVGRGGRVNTVLTKGMNDWEECPELGPVGDILSTSEFSGTASVLIIQQHSLKGELDGLDDEFTIM